MGHPSLPVGTHSVRVYAYTVNRKVVVRAVCTCGFTSQSNSDNTMAIEFGFAHLDVVTVKS